MPRCTQKTSKGLRCKGNGVENDDVIMCATHSKYFKDMPELISIITPVVAPCTHKESCDTSNEKCCECSDMRPEGPFYKAYNKTYLAEFSSVSRNYYYCFGCKYRLDTQPKETFDSVLSEMMSIISLDYSARHYLTNLRSTHKRIIEGYYKEFPTADKDHYWKYVVDDALDHILSERLAGMPEDVASWTGKDAQLNTLMNKLSKIHKSLRTTNPDRPETLEAAYERIDELQKKANKSAGVSL